MARIIVVLCVCLLISSCAGAPAEVAPTKDITPVEAPAPHLQVQDADEHAAEMDAEEMREEMASLLLRLWSFEDDLAGLIADPDPGALHDVSQTLSVDADADESARVKRDTVVFRPLFATRQRDAVRAVRQQRMGRERQRQRQRQRASQMLSQSRRRPQAQAAQDIRRTGQYQPQPQPQVQAQRAGRDLSRLSTLSVSGTPTGSGLGSGSSSSSSSGSSSGSLSRQRRNWPERPLFVTRLLEAQRTQPRSESESDSESGERRWEAEDQDDGRARNRKWGEERERATSSSTGGYRRYYNYRTKRDVTFRPLFSTNQRTAMKLRRTEENRRLNEYLRRNARRNRYYWPAQAQARARGPAGPAPVRY